MTPSIAIVKIESPHWRMPTLWLPLFLLWVPALLLAPFVLLVLIAVCLAGRVNPWRAIATFWAILCALSGTHVHVDVHDARVRVRIL